jgi:hypothetical protein
MMRGKSPGEITGCNWETPRFPKEIHAAVSWICRRLPLFWLEDDSEYILLFDESVECRHIRVQDPLEFVKLWVELHREVFEHIVGLLCRLRVGANNAAGKKLELG